MIHGDMRRLPNGRKKKYNAWSTRKNTPSEFVEYTPDYSYTRGRTDHIQSKNTKTTGKETCKVPDKCYTGTVVKGISTMHKSNAVPIINEAEAKEHASMRR